MDDKNISIKQGTPVNIPIPKHRKPSDQVTSSAHMDANTSLHEEKPAAGPQHELDKRYTKKPSNQSLQFQTHRNQIPQVKNWEVLLRIQSVFKKKPQILTTTEVYCKPTLFYYYIWYLNQTTLVKYLKNFTMIFTFFYMLGRRCFTLFCRAESYDILDAKTELKKIMKDLTFKEILCFFGCMKKDQREDCRNIMRKAPKDFFILLPFMVEKLYNKMPGITVECYYLRYGYRLLVETGDDYIQYLDLKDPQKTVDGIMISAKNSNHRDYEFQSNNQFTSNRQRKFIQKMEKGQAKHIKDRDVKNYDLGRYAIDDDLQIQNKMDGTGVQLTDVQLADNKQEVQKRKTARKDFYNKKDAEDSKQAAVDEDKQYAIYEAQEEKGKFLDGDTANDHCTNKIDFDINQHSRLCKTQGSSPFGYNKDTTIEDIYREIKKKEAVSLTANPDVVVHEFDEEAHVKNVLDLCRKIRTFGVYSGFESSQDNDESKCDHMADIKVTCSSTSDCNKNSSSNLSDGKRGKTNLDSAMSPAYRIDIAKGSVNLEDDIQDIKLFCKKTGLSIRYKKMQSYLQMYVFLSQLSIYQFSVLRGLLGCSTYQSEFAIYMTKFLGLAKKDFDKMMKIFDD